MTLHWSIYDSQYSILFRITYLDVLIIGDINFDSFCCCCFGTTLSSTQSLLLVLHSGLTPDSGVPGIKPESAACKEAPCLLYYLSSPWIDTFFKNLKILTFEEWGGPSQNPGAQSQKWKCGSSCLIVLGGGGDGHVVLRIKLKISCMPAMCSSAWSYLLTFSRYYFLLETHKQGPEP